MRKEKDADSTQRNQDLEITQKNEEIKERIQEIKELELAMERRDSGHALEHERERREYEG